MKVEFLIIGQGIAGTFLSYYLKKENRSLLVIDDGNPLSPSRVAAGVINPVTGRRMVTVWLAEELFPFAWKAYSEMGNELGQTLISQKTVIDFFPNPFMRESFLKRIEENAAYLHTYPEQNEFNGYFNYEFGCGEIRPAYIAHLETMLPAWRNVLKDAGQLLEETFELEALQHSEGKIIYKNIEADYILFCDGTKGIDNPFFNALPFSPNKGEALVLRIPGLPANYIFKKSMTLVPLAEKDFFWLGSTYQWEFEDKAPTPSFRLNAELSLRDWLKIPFNVEEHFASVRPATLERRPFVGMHPLYKNIGILNGFGTKGCSLAPYFAKQLADHLIYHMTVSQEADVNRFERILTKVK